MFFALLSSVAALVQHRTYGDQENAGDGQCNREDMELVKLAVHEQPPEEARKQHNARHHHLENRRVEQP